MIEIYEIFKQIEATSSRNEKEEILRQNKDNQLFKEILYFVYNPFILTGLSTKKINKQVKNKGVIFYEFNEVKNYILKHNTGTDEDIATVNNFINAQPVKLQDFYKKIFTKDVKIGITEDTINKVYGKNFIPTFDVMLAKKYEDHKEKIKGSFIITKKLDGNRIVMVKENGVVNSFTRQCKKYDGLEEIENEIKNISIDNIVFDGELIADTEGTTHEIYTETTSKARKKQSNKTGLVFHVFDILPSDEFKQGKSKKCAVERRKNLDLFFKENEFKHCMKVEVLYVGDNQNMIQTWLEESRKLEWEGIMINLDVPYVCKRTDGILKVKVFQTCDLKVIGFEEGTGQNQGRLGALIVDYKGYPCGVGTGLTESDRVEIWNNQDKYLQKVVEVKYFEESKSQDGNISMRFPVFVRFREDGKCVSYN